VEGEEVEEFDGEADGAAHDMRVKPNQIANSSFSTSSTFKIWRSCHRS
jgi:hypothetical protein